METIKDIVDRNGGMEWLPRRSPLLVSIDPINHFTIEYAGLSPNKLPLSQFRFSTEIAETIVIAALCLK